MWVSVRRWWALAYFVGLVSRIGRQFAAPLTSESDTFCHMTAPQNRAEAAWNRRSPLNSGQPGAACLLGTQLAEGRVVNGCIKRGKQLSSGAHRQASRWWS